MPVSRLVDGRVCRLVGWWSAGCANWSVGGGRGAPVGRLVVGRVCQLVGGWRALQHLQWDELLTGCVSEWVSSRRPLPTSTTSSPGTSARMPRRPSARRMMCEKPNVLTAFGGAWPARGKPKCSQGYVCSTCLGLGAGGVENNGFQHPVGLGVPGQAQM